MKALVLVLGGLCVPVLAAADDHGGAATAQSSTRDAVLRRHALARGETSAEPSAAPVVVAPRQAPGSAKEIWADLLSGNRRFISGKPRDRSLVQTRRALATNQHPRVAVLGCSDSRVSPELVFDQGLGDLFVVRTAGNVADVVDVGSLEYAVDHLHTKVLVVLGHEKCGAVTAAAAGGPMPSESLTALVSKISPALLPLRSHATGDELVHLGVAANVHHSAGDLLEHSSLLKKAVDSGELVLVEAVYDLGSGEVVTAQ